MATPLRPVTNADQRAAFNVLMDNDSPFADALNRWFDDGESALWVEDSNALDEYESVARMKLDTPYYRDMPKVNAWLSEFVDACCSVRSARWA